MWREGRSPDRNMAACGELRRRLAAQRRMMPRLVILPRPLGAQDPCLQFGGKFLPVQELVPQPAVKGLPELRLPLPEPPPVPPRRPPCRRRHRPRRGCQRLESGRPRSPESPQGHPPSPLSLLESPRSSGPWPEGLEVGDGLVADGCVPQVNDVGKDGLGWGRHDSAILLFFVVQRQYPDSWGKDVIELLISMSAAFKARMVPAARARWTLPTAVRVVGNPWHTPRQRLRAHR